MAKKILIVDDEEDIVLVLKMALEKLGYLVSEAYNGLEALKQVESNSFDLILLDIMMPKMDGHTVNIKLKENPKTSNIPVIIITGKGHLKELIDAKGKFKVSAYLEKPFKISMLIGKIKEILI